MSRIVRLLTNFARNRAGVTALEYGLIASVIGGVVITGTTAMGGSLGEVFSTIGNALNGANAG